MNVVRMTNDGEAIQIGDMRCEFCSDLKKNKKASKTDGMWDWWRL